MESHRLQKYDIGEKPTVILYTYINHHVGTPKQKQTSYYTVFLDSRVPDDGTVTFYREIKLNMWCCSLLLLR